MVPHNNVSKVASNTNKKKMVEGNSKNKVEMQGRRSCSVLLPLVMDEDSRYSLREREMDGWADGKQ